MLDANVGQVNQSYGSMPYQDYHAIRNGGQDFGGGRDSGYSSFGANVGQFNQGYGSAKY
jgi:hypothetical protein